MLFCGDLYCGFISDFVIVKKWGYLIYLDKGDFIMVDIGFVI